jgi:hypothetical protein
MHPRQKLGGECVVPADKGDLLARTVQFQPVVSMPSVGMHEAAGLDGLCHKGRGPLLRPRRRSALSSRPTAPAPRRCPPQRSRRPPPGRQPIAVRPNHRAPPLVQPRPRGLLAAQAQHLLQRQGAGTGLRAGDGPHRAKPCRQRGSCVLKDRARRPRRLAAALGTLPQDCAHRPRCRCAAPRAAKVVRPPHLDEIGTTRLLGREACLELGERPWVLVHAAGHYRLGSPESSG